MDPCKCIIGNPKHTGRTPLSERYSYFLVSVKELLSYKHWRDLPVPTASVSGSFLLKQIFDNKCLLCTDILSRLFFPFPLNPSQQQGYSTLYTFRSLLTSYQ